MRKVFIAALLLILMSCTAFAEGEEDPPATGGEPQLIEINLDDVVMTLEKEEYNKTGSEIKPPVTLTYNNETLGTDLYSVAYSNNINVGTAAVTVTFDPEKVKVLPETGGNTITKEFRIVPAKPATASITKVSCSLPNVTVAWNKVSCTGYELQVSLNSDFSGAAVYKQTATSRTMAKMLDSRTYYFKVTPYITESGQTTYGEPSTYSSNVRTTGEVGNKFVLNGAYVKDQTVKYGDNYYYYDASGVKRGCSKTMWNKVKKTKSNTKYLIAVDCTKNRVCVYQGKKNKWNLKYYWKCSTGKKATPTIKGSFKVCGKVSHFGEKKGYSVWYATRIKYEYYFHSILYKPYSKTQVKNGRLGENLSHGCIRLQMSNAKWIYKNCKKRTKIIIY